MVQNGFVNSGQNRLPHFSPGKLCRNIQHGFSVDLSDCSCSCFIQHLRAVYGDSTIVLTTTKQKVC